MSAMTDKSNDSLDDSSLSYIAQFRVHQEFVQAHLKGTLNDEQPLLPAFFPPSSYWTSREKDLFFHGLAVYSRFRPDLIAENIKTKSTFDVCLYLDILQTAFSSIPSRIHGSFRSSLKPAMEVSSRWIQNEEKLAAALIRFDSCTWTPVSADGETSKPENRCVCSPHNVLVADYAGPSPVDHSNQIELKKSYLGHLDCTCLMTLERIIREAQLAEVDSAPTSSSPTPDSSRLPATQTHSPMEEDLSNLDSPESSAVASSIMVTSKKPNYSKSETQYRLMKRLYMRRKRAQSTGKSIDIEAIKLRPGRQTRDRKPSRPRLKMYKKKQKTALLNSSRKESSKKPETVADPEADHVVPDPTPENEMAQEDAAQYEPRSKGGLTKPYQMKNRLLEIGIDSQLASKNHLDFFHLSSLAQLMRLYGLLNDWTGPLCDVSISADTIQLLVAILKEFISEVVRRSLISKEHEIRLKGALKVWKYDQEITVENVKETLKSMGTAHSKSKDNFAELVKEGNDGISSPDPSIDTEMETKDSNNGDASGDDDNQDGDEYDTPNEDIVVDPSDVSDASEQLAELSEVPTEFWLPEFFRRSLLPKNIRLSGNDNDLLPEIDDIGLERELKEEEDLDARDLLTAKEFEAGLWES